MHVRVNTKAFPKIGAAHNGKPLYQHPLFLLVGFSTIAAIVILYWLMGAVWGHDPHWWVHAGIPAKRPARVPTEQFYPMELQPANGLRAVDLPPKPPRRLTATNGTEFIADYDVFKVKLDPEPALTQQHPKYLFHYVDPATSTAPFLYLSNQPRVGWVPNFMTPEECDAIIAEASKTMQRSQVVPYKGNGDQNTVSDVRTSSQTWLPTTTGVAANLVKRIYEFTGFPEGSGEMLQILRYEVGQKYDAHLDYFDPQLYGPQSSNRALTVYLYFSDVEDGGYTQFPRADGKPETYDFKSCVQGLKVRPIKGTMAFFYDMKPNGEYDPFSLHGACKPVVGTKWGGTLWLRVPV